MTYMGFYIHCKLDMNSRGNMMKWSKLRKPLCLLSVRLMSLMMWMIIMVSVLNINLYRNQDLHRMSSRNLMNWLILRR